MQSRFDSRLRNFRKKSHKCQSTCTKILTGKNANNLTNLKAGKKRSEGEAGDAMGLLSRRTLGGSPCSYIKTAETPRRPKKISNNNNMKYSQEKKKEGRDA